MSKSEATMVYRKQRRYMGGIARYAAVFIPCGHAIHGTLAVATHVNGERHSQARTGTYSIRYNQLVYEIRKRIKGQQ